MVLCICGVSMAALWAVFGYWAGYASGKADLKQWLKDENVVRFIPVKAPRPPVVLWEEAPTDTCQQP
jgi:hypothetical protein